MKKSASNDSTKVSGIPVLRSIHKARPAPNFSKLHREWEDKFRTGKASAKKPTTVPSEFDVTKPGTKFTRQRDHAESDGESLPEIDFEGDRLALESILNNRGLSERKVTGRTTVAGPMSTGKIVRSKNGSSIGKRRILGELPCDPDQKNPGGQGSSKNAKKSLKFSKSSPDCEDEFQKDDVALASILSNTGISSQHKQEQSRFTFAGHPSQPQQSLYPVPKYDRASVIDACSAYKNLVLSKLLLPSQKKTDPVTDTSESSENAKKTPDKAKRVDCNPTYMPSPFGPDRYSLFSQPPTAVASPFGTTMVAPVRHSIYKNYQSYPVLTSPSHLEAVDTETIHNTPKRLLKTNTGQCSARRVPYCSKSTSKKSVKWADVLSESSRGGSVIRKEKLKKELFTPLDSFEDDFKENECPVLEGGVRLGGGTQGDTCDRPNANDKSRTQHKHISTEKSCVAAVGYESSLSSGTTDEEATCMTHLFPVPIQKSSQPTNTAHRNKVTCSAATTVTNDNQGGECSNRFGHGRGGETQVIPLAKQHQGQEVLSPLETAAGFGHFSGTGTCFKKTENLAICNNSNFNRGTGIRANDGKGGFVWQQESKESTQCYKFKDGNRSATAATNRDDHMQLQAIEEVEANLSHEQKGYKMAMHTDEGEESGQTAGQTASTSSDNVGHMTRQPNTQDVVDKFVGRIKHTRKRQSIAELNESISESQVHLKILEGEISRLNEGQGSRSQVSDKKYEVTEEQEMNIVYKLELFGKKQDELRSVMKELQDQLSKLVQGQEVKGHGQILQQMEPVIDNLNGNGATKSQISSVKTENKTLGESSMTAVNIERKEVSQDGGKDEYNNNTTVNKLQTIDTQNCELKSSTHPNIQSKPEVPSGYVCTSQLYKVSPKQGESQCTSIMPKNTSDVISMETETIPQRSTSLWRRPSLSSVPSSPVLSGTGYHAQVTMLHTPETPLFLVPKIATPGTPSTPVTPKTPLFNYPKMANPQMTRQDTVTKSENPVATLTAPIWTPVASKGALCTKHVKSYTNTAISTLSTGTDSPADVHTPLDLSSRTSVTKSQHTSVMCSTGQQLSVSDKTVDQSAASVSNSKPVSRSAFSRVKGSPFKDSAGSLSLRANVLSSPQGRERLDELSLRRVVCLRTNERYLEALLDDECALYACRVILQPTTTDRGIVNPVARVLTEGDDMHFVPIMEEGPHAISVRENSAFCCYSP